MKTLKFSKPRIESNKRNIEMAMKLLWSTYEDLKNDVDCEEESAQAAYFARELKTLSDRLSKIAGSRK